MPILLRIALRNLRQHRSKTLIVGILIALGIFTLTLGNSVLSTAGKAIETSYIDSFTGHILVRAKSDTPVSLGGASSTDGNLVGPTVPDYEEVYSYLTSLPEVQAANPQITNIMTIDFSSDEQNRGAIAITLGVDPASYEVMFPDNLRILKGRFLESGEQGVVIPQRLWQDIHDNLGIDVQIGDELKFQSVAALQGGNGGSLKIRRVPVVGIYEYVSDAGSYNPFVFMDAPTLRSMSGMVVGSQDVVDIDAADSSLLDSGDGVFSEDSLFGSDALFGDSGDAASEVGGDDIYGILGDTSARAQASEPDAGAWSYILLRLDNQREIPSLILSINKHFQDAGINAEAVIWSQASGGAVEFNLAARVVFLVMILAIAAVSVIIIMNTLLISVIERTREIGTMRSLGAQKPSVRRLFIAETMSISLVFGTIGLILGVGVIAIAHKAGIPASNIIVQQLFGGRVLNPVLSPGSIISSYLIMLGIGFLSSLYPVRVALKIQPVEAMQSV